MYETNYVIKSKLGYWNVDLREWVPTIYGATWFDSEPFADGQAEFLREKFHMRTGLVRIP